MIIVTLVKALVLFIKTLIGLGKVGKLDEWASIWEDAFSAAQGGTEGDKGSADDEDVVDE